MHFRDCVQATCKNSLIDCHQPSNHPLIIQHLCILVNRVLAIYSPPVGIIRNRCRDLMLGCRSDEAFWRGTSGIVVSYDPKPEAVEWVDSEPEASSDPDAPSELEVDLDGEPINVRSSSDWEAVTTLDVTFLGLPRVALEAGVGVWLPGAHILDLVNLGHAYQSLRRCHRLGTTPRLNEVLYRGNKYLKRNF